MIACHVLNLMAELDEPNSDAVLAGTIDRASEPSRDRIQSGGYATSKCDEANANSQSPVDLLHLRFRQSAEMSCQPFLVDCPNLIQQHYRVEGETRRCLGGNQDLRGIQTVIELGADGSHDGDWTGLVRDIVLQDYSRARFPDLSADCRIEIDQIDVSPLWSSHDG